MIYREFYSELGNLLYAIAKSDGKINETEVEKLKKIVKDELANLEGSLDEYGADLAYLTEFEFETEDEKIDSAEEAYLSFVTFVKSNEKRVGKKLRTLAIKLAEKIAKAFRGKNKSETEMIKKLKYDLGLTKKEKNQSPIYNQHST